MFVIDDEGVERDGFISYNNESILESLLEMGDVSYGEIYSRMACLLKEGKIDRGQFNKILYQARDYLTCFKKIS